MTSVYRKPTFSGLGSSFFSYQCYIFKINAIKTLLFRAYNISSNYFKLHSEFEFLRNYFIDNGYPLSLINSHIKKFLSKQFTQSSSPDNPPTNVKYVTLPFFGPQSEKLKLEFLSLLTKYIPDFTFKIILVNNYKVGRFFNYKDALPLMSRSSVVYQYKCPQCGAMYVGSTTRTLHVRTAEHAGRSHRTGRILSQPPHSSVREHAEGSCDTPVSSSNFSILDRCNEKVGLRILESLYIFKHHPKLNDTNSAFPLSIYH